MNLAFPLFEKNGRNTTLTRFGDEFLACTKQTISTLDGGVDSIQREARDVGVIRVGFLRAIWNTVCSTVCVTVFKRK